MENRIRVATHNSSMDSLQMVGVAKKVIDTNNGIYVNSKGVTYKFLDVERTVINRYSKNHNGSQVKTGAVVEYDITYQVVNKG